jgi:hypothetical protein
MGLMDFFVEKEEKTEELPKTIVQKNTAKPISLGSQLTSSTNFQNLSTSSEVINKNKSEFFTTLKDIYTANNFPGPDYQEFINGVSGLTAIPDEKTRFIAGFTMLSQSGLTKAKLIETAGKYAALLEKEKTTFKSEIQRLKTSEVGNKNKRLETLKTENAAIDKQLQDLMTKKEMNNSSFTALESEINEDLQVLIAKEQGFDLAFTEFVNDIQSNVQKINAWLA